MNIPDIVRVLGGAFELKALPNRAELRLKSTDTVLGYTLSLVRDDQGEAVGAAMFFKDLTHVEQMEERERLRDRLAAVGEMAAVMAHEIKNPLAGIEVLAGLLRRKVPDNADAQALVKDIISEAKMANAIVQEVLAFVRPVRLQVDRTSLAESLASAVSLADGKTTRGSIFVDVSLPRRSAAARRRPASADAGVLQPPDQRIRSARGPRPSRHYGPPGGDRGRQARCFQTVTVACPPSSSKWPTMDRGCRRTWRRRFSIRSSRPRRKAQGSASRSCARSSTPTRAGST